MSPLHFLKVISYALDPLKWKYIHVYVWRNQMLALGWHMQTLYGACLICLGLLWTSIIILRIVTVTFISWCFICIMLLENYETWECTLILVFYYQSGWLCLYAWRSPAALSILWNSEQSDYFDWQVWATKRICICWICWNWCCSECSLVKWIWVAWSSIEGLSIFFCAIDYFMNLLFWS